MAKAFSKRRSKRRKPRRRKPKRRGRIDLRTVIGEVVDRHVPSELQRLSRIRNLWFDLLPHNLADQVWPMLVQGDRLILHVHDSQWLHEMTYWRQDVLTKLRAAWPECGIERMDGYVGPIPPLHVRRPPPPPPLPPIDRDPVLDPEVPSETMEALNAVEDPHLREILAQARMMLGKTR